MFASNSNSYSLQAVYNSSNSVVVENKHMASIEIQEFIINPDNIIKFKATGCSLKNISQIAQFSNLIDLDLSFNQISEVPLLPQSLIRLNLSYNKISNLMLQKKIGGQNISIFSGLNHLKQLFLAKNQIKNFNMEMSNDLNSLLYLDLSENFIKGSKIKALSSMQSLVYLDLDSNDIDQKQYLKDFKVNNGQLGCLILKNNPITSINPKSVEIKNMRTDLQKMYLPNIRNLVMTELESISFKLESFHSDIDQFILAILRPEQNQEHYYTEVKEVRERSKSVNRQNRNSSKSPQKLKKDKSIPKLEIQTQEEVQDLSPQFRKIQAQDNDFQTPSINQMQTPQNKSQSSKIKTKKQSLNHLDLVQPLKLEEKFDQNDRSMGKISDLSQKYKQTSKKDYIHKTTKTQINQSKQTSINSSLIQTASKKSTIKSSSGKSVNNAVKTNSNKSKQSSEFFQSPKQSQDQNQDTNHSSENLLVSDPIEIGSQNFQQDSNKKSCNLESDILESSSKYQDLLIENAALKQQINFQNNQKAQLISKYEKIDEQIKLKISKMANRIKKKFVLIYSKEIDDINSENIGYQKQIEELSEKLSFIQQTVFGQTINYFEREAKFNDLVHSYKNDRLECLSQIREMVDYQIQDEMKSIQSSKVLGNSDVQIIFKNKEESNSCHFVKLVEYEEYNPMRSSANFCVEQQNLTNDNPDICQKGQINKFCENQESDQTKEKLEQVSPTTKQQILIPYEQLNSELKNQNSCPQPQELDENIQQMIKLLNNECQYLYATEFKDEIDEIVKMVDCE